MTLLVNYTLFLHDELSDKDIFQKRFCAVNCPELTLRSEFFNYVKDNKYDSIFLMEKESNGSLELKGLTLNKVEYLAIL